MNVPLKEVDWLTQNVHMHMVGHRQGLGSESNNLMYDTRKKKLKFIIT